MNYFILSQDSRVDNAIKKSNVKSLEGKDLTINKFSPIALRIKGDENKIYGDLIEGKITLVSDNLKSLIEKYDENIFFRPFVFQDIENKIQSVYWFAIFEQLNCLSKESEFNKDGSLKKLVIDKDKANGYRIFKVNGIIEDYIIISLDLAESILRRDFLGLKIKKIS